MSDQTILLDLIPVQVDRTYGDDSILSEGLKEGDVVVTDGQLKLLPDSAVTIITQPPTSDKQPTPANSAGPPTL